MVAKKLRQLAMLLASVVWKWGDEIVQDPPVRAGFPSGSILIDKPTGVFPW